MKTLIAVLLLSLSQFANAQIEKAEKIQIPIQHPEMKLFLGQYNFEEFMKLTCALQLEELLEVNEKYGYADGSQSTVSNGLEQKRYLPDSEPKMQESIKIWETYRTSIWDERSHKYFLFMRYCHAQKNPDQSEFNPAESKKDWEKRIAN